jgi:hypothetical protein
MAEPMMPRPMTPTVSFFDRALPAVAPLDFRGRGGRTRVEVAILFLERNWRVEQLLM